MLADPRVILMTIGLSGLALDLFVRPISLAGLALILLAFHSMGFAGLGAQKSARRIDQSGRTAETGAPLQRSTRAPSREQRNNTGGQNAGVGISERPSQTAAGTVRKI
jgi:hypothetical protein